MSYEPPPPSPDPAGQSPQYQPPAAPDSGSPGSAPGYGPPADPYGPPSDPFNAPPPTAVWNPPPGGGDPYGPPVDPYTPPGGYGPPSGDPYAPQGGDPYAPPSGDPYAPQSGGYGPPAPVSGQPPAPVPGYGPPVSGYPPPAPGYLQHGAPGYGPPPMMPLAPAKKSNTLTIVLVVLGVLLVLCCGGGIVALAMAPDDDPGTDPRPGVSSSQPGTDPDREIAPPDQDSPPPDQGETDNMKVGDTLVLTSSDGDELRITVQKVTSRTSGCQSYATDPDNGTYLIVDVTAEVTKGTASINPLYFKFVDSSGKEENSFGGLFSGCGESLKSGNDLPVGTKRSGTLVFDVTAAKGRIVYAELLGGTRGSWTVG